ncbi:MAG: response regulator [Gemmataceae bacterium]
MPTGRILLVDDEVDSCRNLQDILGELGFEVTLAHNGKQALEKAQSQSFDLVLLDLKMPDMDGISVFRAIRKLRSATVGIIVTAYAEHDTEREALSAGAYRVLAKPVDISKLLRLVESVLEQPLVMIVDDDTDLCRNMWDILRSQGYRVGLARDEKEAERCLGTGDYCVVLIDMKLPNSSGTEVFHQVRQNHPGARTIMITGFRDEMLQQVDQALREGADAVCYKPFDIPGLLGTLRTLVGNKKEAR